MTVQTLSLSLSSLYTLIIKNATGDDGGAYKCITKNVLFAKLVVITPPACSTTAFRTVKTRPYGNSASFGKGRKASRPCCSYIRIRVRIAASRM